MEGIYISEYFPIIEPTEYLYNTAHKNYFVYISVTKVLETLLGCTDFFDKVVFNQEALSGHFKSFQDSKYYKENKLLGEQNTWISLGLYIDDFEVCNQLGTSTKLHKITAVYWVVLNLPATFRSSLTSIQLALLGKSVDIKQYGYEKFIEPLLKDIKCLEQEEILIEAVGQFVKSTVYCVCADTLGAHGLAGFSKSFTVDKFCRFCLISRGKIATTEVNEVELSLCLKCLILKGFITFEVLNDCIKSFSFKYSDKVNKPQKIPKASFEKGTVGHEKFRLRTKHHFIDHYPQLIRCYGPLVELWTMRFEANHSFFKEVVHDTRN